MGIRFHVSNISFLQINTGYIFCSIDLTTKWLSIKNTVSEERHLTAEWRLSLWGKHGWFQLIATWFRPRHHRFWRLWKHCLQFQGNCWDQERGSINTADSNRATNIGDALIQCRYWSYLKCPKPKVSPWSHFLKVIKVFVFSCLINFRRGTLNQKCKYLLGQDLLTQVLKWQIKS